ncbi:probable 4-coumarate--CoA ligase 1 [Anopheles cruzii]|uniref:probable 4-coumarate--CoA ligase 1 n=1 Tax=Anopheles cruzii TaxID=68878 RepID=UPI0022EC798E|nr:probable 4-coumarate--CoA ligase 1 [Anopheles cruzii]
MATFDACSRTWQVPYRPAIFNPCANLGQILINVLERAPEKIIQLNVDTDAVVTCTQMRLRSIRFARFLTSCGYGKGDVLALVARNSCHVVPVVFGCFIAGLPINTIDPSFELREIVNILRLTQPKLIVCDADRMAVLRQANEQLQLRIVNYGVLLMTPTDELMPDCYSIDELLQKPCDGESDFVPQYLGDSNLLTAAIVCSSGTTGLAKAVRISHAQLITPYGRISQLDQNDTILSFSTLFWISGYQMLMTSILNGIRRLITTKLATAKYAIELCNRYNVTILFMTPSLATDVLLTLTDSERLRSLKIFAIGGSTVPLALRQSIIRKVLVEGQGRCVVGYGMSELGGPVSYEMIPRENSVGTLLSGIKAKVVGELNTPLGPGETGELFIRPTHPFLGYCGDEQATAKILDEHGFVRTGDIAYFDHDGFLYLVDRKKNILKYDGYQISPSELEATISQIPGVRQVVVVGIPEPGREFNDLATAMVVLNSNEKRSADEELTEQTIIDHCAMVTGGQPAHENRRLRGGAMFISSLPMTASGKVRRDVAKQMAINFHRNTLASKPQLSDQ